MNNLQRLIDMMGKINHLEEVVLPYGLHSGMKDLLAFHARHPTFLTDIDKYLNEVPPKVDK